MGILDFLALPGQERTRLRDEYLGGLLNYYLGPTGIPERLGIADMMNPVSDVGRAMTSSQEMLAPGRTPMERVGAGATMLADMASVAAPAAATRIAGGDATQGMVEGLLGIGAPTRQGLDDAARRFAADESGALTLGRSGPAIERGQEVLQMLRSGRASEVTDDMLDMGDPTLNARLNMYLYDNYDLPMDFESRARRAIQQNFDVNDEMYRGDAPRSAFQTGRGQRDQIGVTMSSRPDVAASYIPARGEGGIYPLVSRGENDALINAQGTNWNVIDRDALVDFQGDVSALREYIPDSQFEPYEIMSGTDFLNTNDLSRAFQGYGADRVRFNDLVDRGGSAKYYGPESAMPSDVMMVADPANIRSRFARFDPRLAHLRNLSAGVGGLGLLATQTPEQRDEEIRQYLGGLL